MTEIARTMRTVRPFLGIPRPVDFGSDADVSCRDGFKVNVPKETNKHKFRTCVVRATGGRTPIFLEHSVDPWSLAIYMGIGLETPFTVWYLFVAVHEKSEVQPEFFIDDLKMEIAGAAGPHWIYWREVSESYLVSMSVTEIGLFEGAFSAQ